MHSSYSAPVDGEGGCGGSVYIEKETGLEAEVTNDSMWAKAISKMLSLQIL